MLKTLAGKEIVGLSQRTGCVSKVLRMTNTACFLNALEQNFSTLRLRRHGSQPAQVKWTLLGQVFNYPNDPQVQALRNQGPPTGLCGNPELTSPSGLQRVCSKAIQDAKRLNAKIKVAAPEIKVMTEIDALSDILCGVVDLAEFLRNVHTDPKLNTDVDLYNSLIRVMTSPNFSSADRETTVTANLLKTEFDQSCIKGTEDERFFFQHLTQQQIYLGFKFMNGAHEATTAHVEVPTTLLNDLPASVRSQLTLHTIKDKPYMLLLETDTKVCNLILKWVRDGNTRRAVYLATYQHDPKREETLSLLLQVRDRLAHVSKYPTYAHRTLQDSMAKDPETVEQFLKGIAHQIKHISEKETAVLKKLKAQFERTDESVMAWDRSFYTSIAKTRSLPEAEVHVHHYFSLGGVFEGLNMVFTHLYGVSLVPMSTAPGELWHLNVVKLAVSHETEGPLGYIYCDLIARENKSNQAAQYTIRSGRLLEGGNYQQPIVGLMCGFTLPSENQCPLLTHFEVETLFHEMGHAMHSLLGRTKYHHIQGTRCKVDYVEIPSILMESFVWDYRVVSKFARHHVTGEILPKSALERLRQSRDMFGASESLTQICLALVDQRYHGKHPLSKSTTDLLGDVQDSISTIPHVPNTAWQLSFSHLY
eukprot:Ihof_evm8s19 gene=Ihof_evmTU8s19